LKIAGDAPILAEENLLVHLLEIECVIESEPCPRVLEFATADVEGESLHQAEIVDRKFLKDHAFLVDRWEVVSRGPVLGAVLVAPIDGVALERLERDRA